MANKYKNLNFWTGPCSVSQIAEKMREAGIVVTMEGTERVFFTGEGGSVSAAAWNALVDLKRKHGTDFGLNPRQ